MKVLAAIDAFKGSATSEELNRAALEGFSSEWEKVNVPIADGGEGSIEAIYAAHGGNYQEVQSFGPLGEARRGTYLVTTILHEKVAFIEAAKIIGIQLLKPTDQSVRKASSYGLGQLIKDAQNQNITKIYVTLGGSGTSDGGLGLLQSLGSTLVGYTSGNPLLSTDEIDVTAAKNTLQGVKLIALTDVNNPYSGKKGFAEVFAPQKGAKPDTVVLMDQAAEKLAKKIQQKMKIDVNKLPGSGAAGGLGAAIALVGGKLVSGFETISQLICLDELIQQADLIITGEGRLDTQTENGKVPYGIASLAKKYQLPVIALCGSRTENIGAMEELVLGAFSIQQGPISLKNAMQKEETLKNVQLTTHSLARVFRGGRR